jgi:cyclic pyranopterin phosphate synthase
MKELSHVDDEGRAKMVDVGAKPVQLRKARASGRIELAGDTVALIRENRMKKGDVLTVAEIAGIGAAKRTSELIPLCHPLAITNVKVTASIEERGVSVTGEVRCTGLTGVEMEALTAVSVALLTVYDMCKAVDKSMKIGEILLVEKTKEDIPAQAT